MIAPIGFNETEDEYIARLEACIVNLRGALAWIHNNTEPDAIKHRGYDHLASNIYGLCKAALDGEFVDDMHAAEVYDTLYPRSPQDTAHD